MPGVGLRACREPRTPSGRGRHPPQATAAGTDVATRKDPAGGRATLGGMHRRPHRRHTYARRVNRRRRSRQTPGRAGRAHRTPGGTRGQPDAGQRPGTQCGHRDPIRTSLALRTLQQQRRRATDDVTEHALAGCRVLVGIHPTAQPMLGDQSPGQAIDTRLIDARAARAPPAITQRRPPRPLVAQILRREGPPTTATCARRPPTLRRNDPRLGHRPTIVRTPVRA
jgi:hypothetical protein